MSAKVIGIILAVSAALALSGADVQTIKGSSSGGLSMMNVATWGIEAFSAEDDYFIVHDGVSVGSGDRDASRASMRTTRSRFRARGCSLTPLEHFVPG